MQQPALDEDLPPAPRHGVHFSLARPLGASRTAAFRAWARFEGRQVVRREGRAVWTREVDRSLGVAVEVVSRFDLDPRGFAWDVASESPVHGVRGHYRLTPDGRARCRVTAAWHVFARRAWARPLVAATRARQRALRARELERFDAQL